MFCRTCGKELNDKAVACVGCGMDPRDGTEHCPICGRPTKEKQVICTACGASLQGKSGKEWSMWPYIGLLVLSFFVPIFGWIFGGIQVRGAAAESKRKNQAWHFVIAGFVGLFFNFVLMGMG